MKMLKIRKQNHKEPVLDELFEMIADLRQFFDEEANPNDEVWIENINTILDFQDDDGSFKLFDSFNVPTEPVIDFCYMPTYLSSAILMKALMSDAESFTSRQRESLSEGLRMSCDRNFRGHGFEKLKGQIEVLNIFMKAGVREFLDLYPDLCPEFSEMINAFISKFKDMQSRGDFLGPWNESYEDEIRKINEYFSSRNVFVYGTLMRGETNHRYLINSDFTGPAAVRGYDMYNVGWFPAIVDGDGLAIGELYSVPKEDIPSIDSLEGEGHLYAKRCERVTSLGSECFAFVYVYLDDVSGLEKIPAWKEHVWYVSYGSNMLRERFLCYIKGGSFEGSRKHPPCDDETLPVLVRTFDVPYDMYFGNDSGSWGGGVSFLDTTGKGNALGVAYLISREQFEHVLLRENSGRKPTPGFGWYEDVISLGVMDGFEVMTVTNNELRQYNEPCQSYWRTLARGIKENWPEMSCEDIEEYLNGCRR